MMEFKYRLQQAMDKEKMRQIDLSNATGVPKSAINQYLSGKMEPKHDRLHIIAKALGVNPVWLMGYDVEYAYPGTDAFTTIKRELEDLDPETLERVAEYAKALMVIKRENN